MLKCKPAIKDREPKVSSSQCFYCIRDTKYSEKYDFVYECAHDVMEKMNQDEVNELAKNVLDAIRDNFSDESEFEELRLLGDCFARVFMYTLTRGNYYRGAYEKLHCVRETLYVAAEVSVPASAIVNMYGDVVQLPYCWLEMNVRLRV